MFGNDTCREVPIDQDSTSGLLDVNNIGTGVQGQDSLLRRKCRQLYHEWPSHSW